METNFILNLYKEATQICSKLEILSQDIKFKLQLSSETSVALDIEFKSIINAMPTEGILDSLVTTLTKTLLPIFQNIQTIPAHYRLTNKPVSLLIGTRRSFAIHAKFIRLYSIIYQKQQSLGT